MRIRMPAMSATSGESLANVTTVSRGTVFRPTTGLRGASLPYPGKQRRVESCVTW